MSSDHREREIDRFAVMLEKRDDDLRYLECRVRFKRAQIVETLEYVSRLERELEKLEEKIDEWVEEKA